jgi:RNA polymerase sigma factor (sigma-70 family)
LIDLDAALDDLAAFDSRQARVVELRYFGGMENAEIAAVLGISEPTVGRDWRMARAWLFDRLRPPKPRVLRDPAS